MNLGSKEKTLYAIEFSMAQNFFFGALSKIISSFKAYLLGPVIDSHEILG